MMESFFVARRARAEAALLIAEVQVGGPLGADDEFVELYNPSDMPVELAGWNLRRRTAGGTESNLLSDIGRGVDPATGARAEGAPLMIPAHGRFLIVPRYGCGIEASGACFTGSTPPDNYYSVKSGLLAKDNALLLYGPDGELVDLLGWGKAGDGTAALPENPAGGQSLERRSGEGGLEDTADSRADFFVQFLPTPQNAAAERAEGEENMQGAASETPDEISGETPTPEAISDSGQGVVSESADYRILITELLPDPAGADRELEFIELYNDGAQEADLSGWRLADRAGSVKEFVLPAATRLGAGAYRAFYGPETGLSLNNDGDGVRLRDAWGGVVAETSLSGPAPVGAAFIRQTDGTWAWSAAPTPGGWNVLRTLETEKETEEETPAAAKPETPAAVPADPEEAAADEIEYDYADTIALSEIFPDPAGRDNRDGSWEWVELRNEGTRAVDLGGWCLDDIIGKGSKAYCFPAGEQVPAGGFLLIKSETSRLNLNNSGDEVNLLWPDGTRMDRVGYEGGQEGQSYCLAGDGSWRWSTAVTPFQENVVLEEAVLKRQPSEAKKAAARPTAVSGGIALQGQVLGASDSGAAPAVDVAEAKRLPLGASLTVAGLVSAPPGVYGAEAMYLVDANGTGLRVFGAEGLSSLAAGEEVRVRGWLEELGGERQLVAAEVEKLSEDNLLHVREVALAQLSAAEVGDLLRVEGEVASVADERLLWLSADGVRLKVYAKPETGLSFAGHQAGEHLAVTGHLSRTSAGLRLLPRFAGDVRFLEKGVDGIIGESVSAPALGSGLSFPLRSFLCVGLLVLADWTRLRLRRPR